MNIINELSIFTAPAQGTLPQPFLHSKLREGQNNTTINRSDSTPGCGSKEWMKGVSQDGKGATKQRGRSIWLPRSGDN